MTYVRLSATHLVHLILLEELITIIYGEKFKL